VKHIAGYSIDKDETNPTHGVLDFAAHHPELPISQDSLQLLMVLVFIWPEWGYDHMLSTVIIGR